MDQMEKLCLHTWRGWGFVGTEVAGIQQKQEERGKGGNSIFHSMERDWIWGRGEVSTYPSASATAASDIIVPAASAFPVCP